MQIGILGINHKSAELSLREQFARGCEHLFGSHFLHPLFSYVLLSTCNRTEIYFHAEDPADIHTYILNRLRQELEEEFEHRVYAYFGSDCFLHLARVTTGVDSAVIGETEIQGQVKRAYEAASLARTLHSALHFLFQKSLKIGKNIRSSAPFLHTTLSLEEAVLNAASEVLHSVQEAKVLFVGLSEINCKILTHLKKHGVRSLAICNRTDSKAHFLSQQSIQTLPWEKLEEWPAYDLVIVGTRSPHFLIHSHRLPPFASPKLLIDLSVPRNVDPMIGRAPHITLLNIDQLNHSLDRQKAAEIARHETGRIAQAVEGQLNLYRHRHLQRLPLAQVS